MAGNRTQTHESSDAMDSGSITHLIIVININLFTGIDMILKFCSSLWLVDPMQMLFSTLAAVSFLLWCMLYVRFILALAWTWNFLNLLLIFFLLCLLIILFYNYSNCSQILFVPWQEQNISSLNLNIMSQLAHQLFF